jgi:hypothetical protein
MMITMKMKKNFMKMINKTNILMKMEVSNSNNNNNSSNNNNFLMKIVIIIFNKIY